MYEASDPVMITLRASRVEGGVEICVTNNFDPESVPRKGEGVGLSNVANRLRLLYGSSKLLVTEVKNSQFIVTMVIPDAPVN